MSPADERAADVVARETRAGLPADLDEAAPVRVLEQQLPLGMRRAGSKERGVVDDVSIDDRQIQVGVIVGIEERDAKSHKRQRRRTDAGIERHVREHTATVVAEETGRFELMVGHDQIEPPVPVVVGELSAHSGSRLAVPCHGNPRQETDFAEAATTLVVKKKIGH